MLNINNTLQEARKSGYITTYELAERTKLTRLEITQKARFIPGGVKLTNNRWVFPRTVVPWVNKHMKKSLKFPYRRILGRSKKTLPVSDNELERRISEQKKEYYRLNRRKILKRMKKYYEQNKSRIVRYKRDYYFRKKRNDDG